MSDYDSVEAKVDRAIREILGTYGDRVSVESKNKTLLKFGRNDNVGSSFETIWQVGNDESYPTGNDIDIVVSDDPADTQDIVIEGHTRDGNALTFVSTPYTLTGTTPVPLDPQLYRSTRLFNDDNTDFAGNVTVEDDGTSVHLRAPTSKWCR